MQRTVSALLTLGVLTFILLASLVLGGTALTVQAASGPSSSHDGYLLKNSLIFNTYGQFQVNETLIELSNSTTGISSVTFGFPSAFGGHSVAQSADVVSGGTKSEATISQSVSNNTLLLTVSLPHTIPAGTNATVNLGFYVVNTFVATNGSNYNVPMLFYPSVSMTDPDRSSLSDVSCGGIDPLENERVLADRQRVG